MKLVPAAAACAALLISTTGCSLTESNDPQASGSAGDGTITVDSTADACDLTTTKAPSGNLVFDVKNSGDQVTEFYFYAEDGLRIVGEIENVGPGLSRDLVVRAAPGSYVASCRPGMTGKGIRTDFTVTDSGEDTTITGVEQADIDAATTQYAAYVKDQSSQLVDETTAFVTAYAAGQDERARELYPQARTYWERIETVAESFGDLDPKMDLREADLTPGQEWTGWHRIEKDLWPPASGYTALGEADREKYGQDLLANTKTLDSRVQDLDYTVDQIGNGSKGLLDEVASGKITGEEDIWSHTDLYDFQANVDGARVAYEGLKPLLDVKDPALSQKIQSAFRDLQTSLDQYRRGKDDFVSYDTVTEPQRKELSDRVNALAEPLSKLTGAITL
ncbi:PbrT family lead (Pb2+) uptake porter [Marmoricola sp. Leaf446]|uniref:iron uptake system protein EfeO n=1 Tax=Marmoricola sp. Leaf446 TaxID=1736379 RepID=UPI0006FDA90E|nr:iron uptake system protein EfeO [Marmoricola sp. Leaf446]KQT94023.1 PbrT family lead (Pb2+) uptake porter [Marmoricola sp. Leaf446]